MSTGPENRFIKSVNTKLPKEIYKEKMHNPYRGGTADMWYSGKHDAWVEYKWINAVPKKGVVIPDLSGLQKVWLRGRFEEGRTVYVVVGCPEGAIIFSDPADWEQGAKLPVLSKPDYIVWLTKIITGSVDASRTNTTKHRAKRGKRVQDPDHGSADL